MSLKFGILGLLHEKSMTGYDIYQYFVEYINPMWFAQQSQVYRDLGQLEKDQLVVSYVEPQKGKPDKRIYTITAHGVEALSQWIRDFDFSESMRYRDSFALKIFFAGCLPEVGVGLAEQLKRYIAENESMLAQLELKAQEIKAGFEAIGSEGDEAAQTRLLFFKMSMMRGRAQYDMNINWANDVLTLLGPLA